MLQHDHQVLTTAFAPLQPPELPTMVAARSSFDGRRGLPLTSGSGNWGGGRCRCRPRLHHSRCCASPLPCPPGRHPAERRSATPHRRRCTAPRRRLRRRATCHPSHVLPLPRHPAPRAACNACEKGVQSIGRYALSITIILLHHTCKTKDVFSWQNFLL
jgi:hypothetical protein